MKNIRQFLFCVLFGLLFNLSTFAQTNVTSSGMSIQGIARDENNSALANFDQLELIFYVYYLNTANSAVDILTKTDNVTTDNFGVFSYVLDISQQQYNLISNNSAYLKVSQGSVVFSNEKLQAVPYAIHAQNGVPTGSIMPFIGTKAPNGWLLCDGDEFEDDDYHANLKALLGSTQTPNLKGLFLRGTGSLNSDYVGPGLKEIQLDSNKSHNHLIDTYTEDDGDHTHNLTYTYGRTNKGDKSGHAMDEGDSRSKPFTTDRNGIHRHRINSETKLDGESETRPINYGVNYIIKI